MIGMNQIKKRLINGILIGLGIGLIGIVVTILISNNVVKGYREGTNENFLKDYTFEVVTLTQDVVQGETITIDMLQTTRIHKKTAPADAVMYMGEVVGKIAKYNIAANTTAVQGMFAEKLLTEDIRIQEINAITLPIDLMENDYIDVRITYPSGVEYIVLSQKQVSKIYGTTIWMDMSEEETLLLNSAIVDTYLTTGTKLYAVRYSDPTTQIKVEGDAQSQAEKYIREKIQAEFIAGGSSMATPETLTELVSKYAIEYRYYIESFNKVEVTYQPNNQVLSFMKQNEHIVTKAKERLDASLRQNIERNIETFETISGDMYESVVSGISGLVSDKQSLRNELLNGEEY